jgi:hypothetical protein
VNALGWGTVFGLWIAVGLVVAGALNRQGQPTPTALCAIAAWPLFVGVLSPTQATDGPLAARIHAAFAGLRETLHAEHPTGAPDPSGLDVSGLEAALLRADARIARVDRLLAETTESEPPPEVLTLRAARDASVRQVEAALAEVARVRVQVGLVALSHDASPVRAALADLAARVRVLEEVGTFSP